MSHKKTAESTRKIVELRAKRLCEYCKLSDEFSNYRFHVDYVIPFSKGGEDSLENLALSCIACNGSKYNKTKDTDPISSNSVRLFNPRKDDWIEHFEWANDLKKKVLLR